MFGVVPCLDEESIRGVLQECFGVTEAAQLQALPSERDQNVRVTLAGTQERLVLKIANESEDRGHLEAQCALLGRVAELGACPRAVGASPLAWSSKWPRNALRLVTYAEGRPLATLEAGSLDAQLFVALGKLVGRMDVLLRPYDHPALHRPGLFLLEMVKRWCLTVTDFPWDLSQYATVVNRWLPAMSDSLFRAEVESVYTAAHGLVAPRAATFTHQTLHNDLNTWNIIVGEAGSIALIDFGDAAYSWTICEVAIMAAYAFLLEGARVLVWCCLCCVIVAV
jgi:Ser/Thr protein kinase RdoA (MazF antagonist)